ncbi:uncharacterized protein LOC109846096 [Asparagus officinalis]|uniref:uncharacterized protein LOC109846096 n=1 Tax=Asparagus officinalis TaxID=4686 RepID=UPI00098E6F53|nr:uncharacterized protein LOC109846096 [Asparagus officinalis]
MAPRRRPSTPVVPEGNQADQADLAEAIRELVAHNRQRDGHHQVARSANVSDFRKLNPQHFAGTEGGYEAEMWLQTMDRLLRAAKIPDEDRVDIVQLQLVNVARTWWDAEEEKLPQPISWETFRESFLETFFPKTSRLDMQRQFAMLRQRANTVDEYAAEFAKLSRFAPGMISNEVDKGQRFMQGLNFEIQTQIYSQKGVDTYADVLEAAQKAEQLIGIMNSVRRGANKRHAGQTSGSNQQKPQTGGAPAKRQQTGTSRPAPQPTNMVCHYCKKPGHLMKDCWKANGLCLICGAADHQLTTCPSRRVPGGASGGAIVPRRPGQYDQQAQQQQRQGQVLTLTAEQADTSGDVVTGTILVYSVPAFTLFDSGASHCFISAQFIARHTIPCDKLDASWNIHTGSGVLTSSRECKKCPVVVCGRELFADLLVIDTNRFDVILGMDWLYNFYATIDCRRRSVVFKIPDHPDFEFMSGSKVMEHPEYRAGVEGVLTCIEVEEKPIPEIVKEFLDVFPNELPGLPPDRDIEFVIDLIPGVSPISKPPYRMPIADLEELRKQVQEYLDKQFIRLSTSPWGAPMVLVPKPDGS